METRELGLDDGATNAELWFDERPEPVFTDADSFERWATFEGLKLQVVSQQFRGGRLTAVLSGVTVDLREAVLAPEGATLSVDSRLSGIDILVPRDWDVVCDVDAVCAGIDDEPVSLRPLRGGPRLRVVGTVVAGGLFVR